MQITNYRNEEDREILDNYIAIKYEDEVRAFLTKSANDVFGSSRVFYAASGRVLSPDLTRNATLSEYYNCRDGLICAVIALKDIGYEYPEQITTLAEEISNTLLCDEISILLIVVDNDTFESADESKLRNLFLTKSGIAQASLQRHNGETKLEFQEGD